MNCCRVLSFLILIISLNYIRISYTDDTDVDSYEKTLHTNKKNNENPQTLSQTTTLLFGTEIIIQKSKISLLNTRNTYICYPCKVEHRDKHRHFYRHFPLLELQRMHNHRMYEQFRLCRLGFQLFNWSKYN